MRARPRPHPDPRVSLVGPDPPGLADYGVIGNLRTAALVSRAGSVDWACMPRFSSPSVFGRILGGSKGGSHRVAAVGASEAIQRYVPGTNVLQTHFRLPGDRSLAVTDFMPLPRPGSTEGDCRIYRQLVATGGDVGVRVDADPRCDYGRGESAWDLGNNGSAIARSGPARVWISSPWPWRPGDGTGVRSEGEVHPGAPLWLTVSWGQPDLPSGHEEALEGTIRFWRAWVAPPNSPLRPRFRVWADWVERSELVLKLLSQDETGAFVAAPTTSLPEWPGGGRNWDYRYVWLRDAAFTAQVFMGLGHVVEARAYLRWVISRLATLGPDDRLRTVYDAHGHGPPAEETLPDWEGYLHSQPVRIGNAAVDQMQLDIYGETLDAAALLERYDPGFLRSHWPQLSGLARRAAVEWQLPDHGLWEVRTTLRHHVHSKLLCWVATDRAATIAQGLGKVEEAREWRKVAEHIREEILQRGYDESVGSFVQAFGQSDLDASVLRVPLTGLLPFDDPRVRSTVQAVEEHLAEGAFVHRYRNDDGVAGPEGAFLLCSFWLVECLARTGQREHAVRNFRSLLRAAGPLRLFAEEYDPRRRLLLGNFPQAFSHIGLLRAALALGVEIERPATNHRRR